MALSSPRTIFGVHSFSPYNRTTGEFYGQMSVLQNSSVTMSGDLVTLQGGSQRFPWQVEDGFITAELALSFNQYPDFVYELFLGKDPTNNAAETTGNASTLTNKNGTSVVDASTGIATIGVKSSSETDLKFGKLVVKAASATTVDVYYSSNIDFARGTDDEFESDLLKVTASPLTISTGAAVEIPNFGLELTGGSGTIGMTTGDTATAEIRPINTSSNTVTIGGLTDTFPEFGALVYAQQQGSGNMYELDLFRVKVLGMPINFEAKTYSTAEVTGQCFYDSSKSGVLSMREIII